MLEQVYIEPTTSTNTYKFKILDSKDRVVFDTATFIRNILNRTNTRIPLKGVYEVQLYEVDTQEDFKLMLGIKEDS